ncbi:MAG: UbiA family prenyltransferase [Candidatus Aenigmatarchaeota archaeon]
MSKFKNLLLLMRPKQWFKSFYVIFGAVPAIFLSPFIPYIIVRLLFLGIINLVFIQGVIYSLNDISDLEEDRKHPEKKKRPIASGKVSKRTAKIFSLLLLLIGCSIGYYLDFRIFLADLAFLAINLLYSYKPLRLKDRKYLDVLFPALNFPLRVAVGWWLFEPFNEARFHLNLDVFSNEIVSDSIQTIFFHTPPRIINLTAEFSTITLSFVSIMGLTYFLACFLLSMKRLAEKLWLDGAENMRKSLKSYSIPMLKALSISFMVISSILFILLAYSLKYSLMILTPIFLGFMIWYYRLSFQENSPVQKPEKVFTENPKFISTALISLFIGLVVLLI